jgi:hypothetical protein
LSIQAARTPITESWSGTGLEKLLVLPGQFTIGNHPSRLWNDTLESP